MKDIKSSLRPMSHSDLQMVLEWRNHPSIRMHMYKKEIIEFKEHENWFKRVIQEPYTKVLIYEYDHQSLGYINFKSSEKKPHEATWGFYLSPSCKLKLGRKMGNAALKYGFNIMKYKKIWGEVLKNNIRSRKYHEKLGFIFIENSLNKSSNDEIIRYSIERDLYYKNEN